MKVNRKTSWIIRRMLSAFLVVVGLSTTWAWGQVARLAAPKPASVEQPAAAVYAAWQPEGGEHAALFRSTDEGTTWQALSLPAGREPVAWADDGGKRLAVTLDDGQVLRSEDRGDSWTTVVQDLPVLSLTWGSDGSLYLGTNGHGVYRQAADGSLAALPDGRGELSSAEIVGLAVSDGRLFALTPTVLFYADAGVTGGMASFEGNWIKSLPLPEQAVALAATGRETVYAGTAIAGIYKSTDAGQTWQPASDGLGLAAGQMVKITALRADPREPGILYAAVDQIVGSTQVYASAAGAFVTLNEGASWQPLVGPAFPQARHALALVVAPDKPLYAQVVTAGGLQSYTPDVAGALAALASENPLARAEAAQVLGLARAQAAEGALLAALDDSDLAVSLAAADALGRIGDPATVNGLLGALEHPSAHVRLGAARALGQMRATVAVEPLRTMLLLGDGLEVSVASEALGRIGNPAAIDALLATLADPVPTPRWHAAMGVLNAMGEPAIGPLVERLDSQDLYVRRNAAQALGWIGSRSATAALVHTLKDQDVTVRTQAAWALGEIGDPATRAALERAQRRDPSTAVQAEASTALARIPEQAATATGLSVNWAATLDRWQPLRWLILALSLVAAAWLAVNREPLAAIPILRRNGW